MVLGSCRLPPKDLDPDITLRTPTDIVDNPVGLEFYVAMAAITVEFVTIAVARPADAFGNGHHAAPSRESVLAIELECGCCKLCLRDKFHQDRPGPAPGLFFWNFLAKR